MVCHSRHRFRDIAQYRRAPSLRKRLLSGALLDALFITSLIFSLFLLLRIEHLREVLLGTDARPQLSDPARTQPAVSSEGC